MNSSFSQNLLVAIVHGLRNACKRNIKSENFMVISGFLCCDVDGKTQHRFVISEIINRANNGEGHSSCLKVIDWNNLGRKPVLQRNEKNWKHNSVSQSPVAHKGHGNDCHVSQTGSRCGNAPSKMRKDSVKKCLSGPVSHGHFTGSRNKKSNQTFTLDDFQLPLSTDTSEPNPKRNFSSATISITSQPVSSEMEVSEGQVSPTLQLSPEVNSAQTSLRLTSSQVCRPTSPSSTSLCEAYESQIWKYKSPESPSLNNNLSEHFSLATSNARVRVNSSFIINKVKRMSRERNLSGRGSHASQKLCKNDKNCLKIDHRPVSNSRGNLKQIVKQSHTPNTDDSDVSIDSIRPRYLVQHNDELLLPCPNLSSKYSKHLAATKNNNRTLNVNLSNQCCEEHVPHTSRISNFLSSIIGAMSQSSTLTLQDTSKSMCAVSPGLIVGKSEESDKTCDSSSDSLKSVTSLETDSPRSCIGNATETSNHKYKFQTKKFEHVQRTDSKENQETSSAAKRTSRREEDGIEGNMSSRWHQNQLKKKDFGGAFGLWSGRQGGGTGQRVLNWMKLFRRNSGNQQVTCSGSRHGSYTSLKSLPSLKYIIGSSSKYADKQEEPKERKHGK